MIRRVIGIIFCVVAFMVLIANASSPNFSRNAGEIFGRVIFELAIGVTLIVFGNRALALRGRIVAAAAEQLKSGGSLDVAQLARSAGISEPRARKILSRGGFAAQLGP